MQFGLGVLTGVTASAAAVQLWFARGADDYREMYRDFGGPVPTLTKLVLHPIWVWGLPLLALAMVAGVIKLRTTRAALAQRLAVVTCIAMVGVLVLTYWESTAPIRQLAGAIRD
jgi:hypothetical protein